MKAGASLKVRDDQGRTALEVAREISDSTSISIITKVKPRKRGPKKPTTDKQEPQTSALRGRALPELLA